MPQPYRLTDNQMKAYIVNGYITLKTDLPPSYHKNLYERTETIYEKEGNPGNNLLPRMPDISQIFEDSRVVGALEALLGPDYYLHPHRHGHRNPPGSKGQNMHKDSWTRRSHRTRWAMAFYYPQDTPVTLGPSGIVPGSHYFNTYHGSNEDETPVCGEAGTITIVHYDLWHRAMPNMEQQNRYMLKFLFTRMEEPIEPTWTCRTTEWTPPENHPATEMRNTMWQHAWDWHCGKTSRPAPHQKSYETSAISDHIQGLSNTTEETALHAAYALANIGAPAIPALIEAITNDSDAVRRNAGYALAAIGAPAVPALAEVAKHPNAPVRSSIIETLGDIGPTSHPTLPVFLHALTDTENEVRQKAADALGVVAQQDPAAASALANALLDPDETVCVNAALSLAHLGRYAQAAVPELVTALNHTNRYVVGNAVQALKRIGTPEAIQALLKSLSVARWCPTTTPENAY